MKEIKDAIRFIDEKIDLKKLIKFGITGVLNTAIDLALYALCLEVFKLDIKIAQPAGQCAAIVNSYLMNKNWTFKKHTDRLIPEMLKFLAVNGGSIALNVLGVYILHDILGLGEYLCKIPIALVTIAINYFGNKLFVFREAKRGDSDKNGNGE
ncbi:MAG: GtrA family protein [Oscillospiraceae bacterium]|nr:GtrA family protein [Oscillospiraceae bacterium]